MASGGLVSICIPTYNGEHWLYESIGSALAQTYAPLEIVIVDDRSTDDTLEIARSFRDPRLRIEVNSRNLGIVGNRNESIKLSKGDYIKFLFQDDLLYPTCVEKMVQIIDDHESVGVVFSSRDILLENTNDPNQIWFRNYYSKSYENFGSMGKVNRGTEMFGKWLTDNFRANWIGEPSNVMLRRSTLRRIGLFNARMKSCSDFEMWIRMMHFSDVGFLNETLSAFRFHSSSAGAQIRARNLWWLDRLWLLEGILEHPEIERHHPQVKKLRDDEFRHVLKQMASCSDLKPEYSTMIKGIVSYCKYRSQRFFRSAPPIHERLDPVE